MLEMQIVDVLWSSTINILEIQCPCGLKFRHRSDRWRATCPRCSKMENLDAIRERYGRRHAD